MKKRQKETAEEFKRKLLANPEYLRSLEEDAKIILAGDKAGRWKTLEEIEKERTQQRLGDKPNIAEYDSP